MKQELRDFRKLKFFNWLGRKSLRENHSSLILKRGSTPPPAGGRAISAKRQGSQESKMIFKRLNFIN